MDDEAVRKEQLDAFCLTVDFEVFRPDLELALAY
jgi:hypothetical protein